MFIEARLGGASQEVIPLCAGGSGRVGGGDRGELRMFPLHPGSALTRPPLLAV